MESGKQEDVIRRVFKLLLFYGLVETSITLNCACLHNIQTESHCIQRSLPTKTLSLIVPEFAAYTVMHCLYLLITDLMPTIVYIMLYLDRVQEPVNQCIERLNYESSLHFKSRKLLNEEVGTGNELIVRYTHKKRESFKRQS